MNVLVTGNTGFVGTNFINSAPEFYCKGCDLLTQKVSEIDFTGIDSVIHLAALVHQMKGATDEAYFKVNRDLAYEVAKRAKDHGVKQFVFMSTAKVYGESTAVDGYWNENSLCSPADAYGKSKYEAEKLISELSDDSFKVAIIRSPLVYGVGVKANMLSLIKLIDKFPIIPLGGISNKRSTVYIGNLVELLKHVIHRRSSGIIIAGDPAPLSTTSLACLIIASLGKKRVLIKLPKFIVKALGVLKPSAINRLYGSLVLDNTFSNQTLQFTSPYTSEQGIGEMVKWYKENRNC